ncbi:isoprenoid synthase domain-containing protein [Podospora appendiculata]|uniref:Terpene synthase n=1 Tax=Podospora appendiculata TaxID=314037 RepID=A0AAE0XHZ1_9PEZI|nr:isoprenoid synthase domain-containing protein [Podospora appendiculata]
MPVMPDTRPTTYLPIVAKLKGQVLTIPDLRGLFSRWPAAVSPHQDELARALNERLPELVPSARSQKTVHKINLPLFVSRLFPTGTLERLKTMTLVALWLFVWDDSLDEGEHDNATGRSAMDTLRRQTLAYARFHMGLDDDQRSPAPVAPLPNMTIFAKFAEKLRQDLPEAHLMRLWRELEFYLESCFAEQNHLSRHALPSVDEYWKVRLGSIGLTPYTALVDYVNEVTVPDEIFESDEVNTLWLEATRNIILVNDSYSLKKELDLSVAYSLIPIMMNETLQDLSAVVREIVRELDASADHFDDAADRLLAKAMDLPAEARAAVGVYVRGLKLLLNGSLYWTLAADRYGMSKYVETNGSRTIPL